MEGNTFSWLSTIPDILRAAAASTLGFSSLSVVAVAFIGLILKPSGDSYRVIFGFGLTISLLCFTGVTAWKWQHEFKTPVSENLSPEFDRLLQKSSELMGLDRLGEARSALDEARKLLPKTGSQLLEGRMAIELGKIERISGNPILARQQFAKALFLLPKTAFIDCANAHLEEGITLSQQDKRSDARREIETALLEFRGHGDRSGEGRALVELAELLYNDGNYTDALARLNEAETAFETARDRLGLANVDRIRGAIERIRDRSQFAIPYLEKARSSYQVAGSRIGEVQALWELGEAKIQLGQFDDARMFHQEGLRIAESIGFKMGIRNAYLAFANLEVKRNRPQNAVPEFRRAIDYLQSVGDKMGETQARLGLGSTLILLSNTVDARKELALANDLAMSLRDATVQSQTQWYQALLDMQSGRLNESVSGFEKALNLAEEAKDIGLQGKAYQGLGDARAKLGMGREAHLNIEHARQLFQQANMKGDSAIAGLSLVSLRLSHGDKGVCSLIDDVIRELEEVGRQDLLALARQLQEAAQCGS